MHYFSVSVSNYVKAQVKRYRTKKDSGKTLIMLPSLPAGGMLDIGRELEVRVLPLVDHFVYKIAKPLWKEWETSGNPAVNNLLEEAMNKGWMDDLGNLTYYRNEGAGKQGETGAVILGGMDHVTDAGSLADFHCCDINTIWKWSHGMNKSFTGWVRECLEDNNIYYEDEVPDHFDEVLLALLDRVPTDILSISEFLDQLDLSGCQDGRDVEQALLRGLGFFGLPDLSEFKFGGRQKFGPYVDTALSFFSYSMFLETRQRINAVKAVKNYKKKFAQENRLFENEQIGPYKSDDEFLNALADYINEGGQELKKDLLGCDFTVIRDKILKYKEPGSNPPKTTVKKLGNDPLESVLTGLWLTMGEFRKKLEPQGVIAHDVLNRIYIKSFLFKHDCDGGNQEERNEAAKDYLGKIIGGLDHWLSTYIELEAGEEDVQVDSHLVNQDMDFQYSAVAEPVLGFEVRIDGSEIQPVSQRFFLRLPATSPFRIAAELFRNFRAVLQNKFILPVYFMPYFEELMLAKDEEEANRVLMHGVRVENDRAKDNVVDLLSPLLNELEPEEAEYGERLKALSHAYHAFVAFAADNGLYAALTEKWDDLRRVLDDAFNVYLDKESLVQRDKGVALAKAFLMVNDRSINGVTNWVWQPYETAAAVTVLHPALLELVHARIRYLFDCFNAEAARQISTTERQYFKKSTWDYYLDLAAIKMPLCGLIKDEDLVFDSSIKGESLLHRIGGGKESEAALSTRLLLKYDSFEDEDISDREMFHETRESLMLFRIIRDYWELHPHAKDGISLAVYQNQDVQPLIAAIDQFVSYRYNKELDSVFHMSLTLFSESCDDTGIRRWIEQWKERWEAAENHSKFFHYRACRLSVSHRIVTPDDDYAQFIHIINSSLEADIAFLSHFISAGARGNLMEKVPAPHDVTSRPIQFPILEKAFCASNEKRHADERFRVLSNRQFMVATKHLEVMACLRGIERGHHIALGRGDFSPWKGVINALHKNVEWVVCIDPSVDEQLLKQGVEESVRDLIGFGSGVGSHGEANYTISTEQFRFSDLLHKLKASILNVVEGWSNEDHIQAAQFAIDNAKDLSGLSLIRATGVNDHIREILAYALARKKFYTTGKNSLCDQFISLDAYRHWFDNASSNMRPDILWLSASVEEDNTLHLDLRIIECKLGKKSDIHLEKAREQVDCGLRHLIPSFMPRQEKDTHERPDARYWWLQLHRLIASKSQVKSRQRGDVLAALERLADGDYSVSWGGAFFTCWTNVKTENRQEPSWTFGFREHELDILHVALGSEEMKTLCTQEYVAPFNWGNHLFSCKYKEKPYQNYSNPDGGEDEENEDTASENDLSEEESPIKDKAEQAGKPRCSSQSTASVNPKGKAPSILEPSKTDVIPDRIPLGISPNGSRQVFWEFGHHGLHNRHILLFGSSGMGKTYAIQCLLNELGMAGQNSLVVDYTNGFLPDQLENITVSSLAPEQHIIRQAPLPISPFKLQAQMIGDIPIPESLSTAAKRISAIFKTVYDLGDQQFSVLFDSIISGMESHGENLKLDDLLDVLEDYLEDKKHNKSTVQSTLSKLKPFVMDKPFSSDTKGMGWSHFFENKQNLCHVFQLAGLDMHSWRLVTEFILWDLYAFVRGKGNKNLPKVVVLDEVQNLDHREECPLAKYLTEGRKFGLSLILATQTLSNLSNDQQSRLFQAGHKLFFRPAETEIQEYGKVLQNATGEPSKTWINRLSKLKKGECYSLGPSLGSDQNLKQVAVKIKITAMEDRALNG